MKVSDIELHAKQLVEELRPFLEEAHRKIAAVVEDCEAHGLKAVTETLRAKPDGRPTLRHSRKNPSLRAAMRKLGDLLEWACGPALFSNYGRFRDVRHMAYISGYEFWRTYIPDEIGHYDKPQTAGWIACRSAPIHGLDVRTDFEQAIERARKTFGAAVARAGISGSTDAETAAILGEWRRKAESMLVSHATRILSDGQIFADNRAALDAVHPEHRAED